MAKLSCSHSTTSMTEAVIFSKFGFGVSVASNSEFQVFPTEESRVLDADHGFLRVNSATAIQVSGVSSFSQEL